MLQYRYGCHSIVQLSSQRLQILNKIALQQNISYVESYELSMLCKRYEPERSKEPIGLKRKTTHLGDRLGGAKKNTYVSSQYRRDRMAAKQ